MYYNKEGYTLYYEKYGQGENKILILPGWGDTRKTFDCLINWLQEDFTIYIIDYPGFGNSPFPNHDLTIYDYTNIIRNFMTDTNIINPIIIAHSFGGRIATLLTGYYKEKIDKLIFIDIASIKRKKSIKVWLKEKTYKLLKLIKKILPKKLKDKYHQKLLKLFGSKDYKSLPEQMLTTFRNVVNEDLRYYLPYIENETLLIWGEKDIDTPLKDAKLIQKKIKNSALIIYPNATHYSYLEYPILTYNIIEKFLLEKDK